MRKILYHLPLIILGLIIANPLLAENEDREVPSFSEISLRIPGKLYIEQGKTQSINIEAKSSALEEIVTEVRDRQLTIRFKSKNYLFRSFEPGKIIIHITVPEIDALSVSGSGDIIAEDEINTRILDLAVSGSGDISLEELKSERVKAAISGSGNIIIKDGGVADDFSTSISGSGDVKASGFEAKDVVARIAGSGNFYIKSNGSIKAKIAGSGSVFYNGNPSIDSSVAGSGKVQKQ